MSPQPFLQDYQRLTSYRAMSSLRRAQQTCQNKANCELNADNTFFLDRILAQGFSSIFWSNTSVEIRP